MRRESDEFDYGYALTVHKAQGSQWDDVMLFDESYAFREHRARWLYTGVTRASRRSRSCAELFAAIAQGYADDDQRRERDERPQRARQTPGSTEGRNALEPNRLTSERRRRELSIGRQPALGALADNIGACLGFGRSSLRGLDEIVEPSPLVLLVDGIGDKARDFAIRSDEGIENRVTLGILGRGGHTGWRIWFRPPLGAASIALASSMASFLVHTQMPRRRSYPNRAPPIKFSFPGASAAFAGGVAMQLSPRDILAADDLTILTPAGETNPRLGSVHASPTRPEIFEPMKMIRVAIARRSGQPQAGQALQDDIQRDAQFQSRQGRADAEMNALRRTPGADWAHGVDRTGPVRQRSAGRDWRRRAAARSDPPAAILFLDLDVPQRVAREEMQRRIEPQQFFDHRLVDAEVRGGRAPCSSIALRPLPMPWTVAS